MELLKNLKITITNIKINITYIPFELTSQLFIPELSCVFHLKNLTGILIFSEFTHFLNSYSEN